MNDKLKETVESTASVMHWAGAGYIAARKHNAVDLDREAMENYMLMWAAGQVFINTLVKCYPDAKDLVAKDVRDIIRFWTDLEPKGESHG